MDCQPCPPQSHHGNYHGTYAIPCSAWWGLTSADDKSRLERFKDKVTRMRYLHVQANDTSVADSVAAAAEQLLFRLIERNPNQVLRALLPPKACSGYDLRPRSRTCSYALPIKDDGLYPKSFIQHLF